VEVRPHKVIPLLDLHLADFFRFDLPFRALSD